MAITPEIRQPKIAWLLGATVASLLLVGILFWATISPWWKFVFDSPFDQEKARHIFSEVQRGALVPDAAGRIVLPGSHSTLTRDGRIYVTRKDGLLMVLFPTWRGRGADVRGYLWCNRPLTTADVEQSRVGGREPSVTIWVPWAGPEPHQDQVTLVTPLDTMPYYISRLLD